MLLHRKERASLTPIGSLAAWGGSSGGLVVKVIPSFLKLDYRLIKVIRKFFLNHNKSFRWHLEDYEKHNFSPFEGL